MAKRKRLTPAAITGAPEAAPESKSFTNGWQGVRTRAPIADISADAASQAAFEEVAQELHDARAEGRMVISIPLSAVVEDHLVRDRVGMDADDMAALMSSLEARGQQTPIEVVDLGAGRYGLISGWRRLSALKQLLETTGEDRFGRVQALVRAPEGAPEAYQAMVEENEVRANLSFYERARIAVQAARAGVYVDATTAVQALFATARAPKRSKVLSFTHLVEALDDTLRFPTAIPEKLGLALVTALQADKGMGAKLQGLLQEADPQTALAERRVLDAALKAAPQKPTSRKEQIGPGLVLNIEQGRVTLSGKSVDADLIHKLRDFLKAQ